MSYRSELWHQEQIDAAPTIVTLADRGPHRARKERRLNCGHIIKVKEWYREIVMIVDGEFTIDHECQHCYEEWNSY